MVEDYVLENSGEIQKITIDLGLKRKGNLEENAYTQMGAQLGYALKQILAGVQPFLDVRGTPGEIASLAAALGMEKRHLEDIIKHGANSPQARTSLAKTNKTAARFQQVTGIPWPFTS